MTDARVAALSTLGGLEEATEDVIRALAARFQVRTVAAGETVCHAGDGSRHIWVCLAGELECVRPGPGGDTRAATIPPGRLFGQVGLYTRAPRQFTLRALVPSTLLEMDDAAAESLLREPGLVGRAYRRMVLHALLMQLHAVDASFLRLAVAAARDRTSEDPSP